MKVRGGLAQLRALGGGRGSFQETRMGMRANDRTSIQRRTGNEKMPVSPSS